ncbi:hypothetical protein K438DRAFT_1777100 [Mycena galopus ATCC 62051]|nr:hypothetical protein K438DRAFT_1777100 [Mycena galopus ATCC 62051]
MGPSTLSLLLYDSSYAPSVVMWTARSIVNGREQRDTGAIGDTEEAAGEALARRERSSVTLGGEKVILRTRLRPTDRGKDEGEKSEENLLINRSTFLIALLPHSESRPDSLVSEGRREGKVAQPRGGEENVGGVGEHGGADWCSARRGRRSRALLSMGTQVTLNS